MNSIELADEFKEENNDWNEDNLRHWGRQTEAMLRQQQAEIEALKAHPVKEQSNLIKVVQNHVKDLKRCVKVFRTKRLNNTANEMEDAIKELEDALEANTHPIKELKLTSEIMKLIEKNRKQKEEIDSLYYENSMLKNRHNLQQAEIKALKAYPVKELKIHEDIVYGLAYKHRIEKGDVQGFAMELLRKAQE